jgi:drug/metabolite transporter (DMT)-like permease
LAAVGLIAAPGAVLPDPAMVAFLPVAMIGPLCYALEGLYVARYGTVGMDPVQAMFGASVAGLVMCLPVAVVTGQMYNPMADFGADDLALIGSSAIHGLMYAGYVWLAARAGAVFASQCSYIVTGAGIFWAMALLGERFSPTLWLSLVLLLCGVALVSPRERVRPAEAAPN